jgi:hypothetical protein
MVDNQETRDMAIRAMTNIENHIASCDRRYEEWRERQDKTLEYLKDITDQMGAMKDQIAEARGAGKMAKIITGAVSGIMGLVGGASSHIIIK